MDIFAEFDLSVTCLCEIRYSVGANSFALKIRHGFTEDSLKPSSNFISWKRASEPIVNIGVHIVRMNSHLQLSTSLFTQTGYTHFKFRRRPVFPVLFSPSQSP